MKEKTLRQNLLFVGIQLSYWICFNSLYFFLVMYLTDKGYSKMFCGAVTTCLAVISIFWQPLMGYITDTLMNCKKLLLITFGVGIPLSLLVPGIAKFAPLCFGVLMINSLCSYSQHMVTEAWILKLKDENEGINYGLARSVASIGAGCASLFTGEMTARFGMDMMFYIHAGALVCGFVFCLFQTGTPCLNSKKYRAQHPERIKDQEPQVGIVAAFRELIHVKEYMVYIVSAGLYHMAMRSSQTYLSVFVTEAGGDAASFGMTIFATSIIEFLCMLFVVAWLMRKGIPMEYVYMIAICVAVFRIFSFTVVKTVPFIIAMNMLQAVAIGFYSRVNAPYMASLAPAHLKGTAITLGMALSWGVGSVLGNFTGGMIMEYFGTQTYAYFSTVICVLSVITFLPNLKRAIAREKTKKLEQQEV